MVQWVLEGQWADLEDRWDQEDQWVKWDLEDQWGQVGQWDLVDLWVDLVGL